ncbi:MAG: PIN domain-containing protein [Oscillospiraceae bacterium]|nr:PIN domain-containing protein [Oscillospiraceae bacterium]
MKIYLDCCCLNRPFDDHTQLRVRIEAEAVRSIIDHCRQSGWSLVSSGALDREILRISNKMRQTQVRELYAVANEHILVNSEVRVRTAYFKEQGLKLFDGMHLALAEAAGCDVFLTTDDRLFKAAKRLPTKIHVSNPVVWLMEVFPHG